MAARRTLSSESPKAVGQSRAAHHQCVRADGVARAAADGKHQNVPSAGTSVANLRELAEALLYAGRASSSSPVESIGYRVP
jgi:hypothetical protein